MQAREKKWVQMTFAEVEDFVAAEAKNDHDPYSDLSCPELEELSRVWPAVLGSPNRPFGVVRTPGHARPKHVTAMERSVRLVLIIGEQVGHAAIRSLPRRLSRSYDEARGLLL